MTTNNPIQPTEPVAAAHPWPSAALSLTKECKHSARFDAHDPVSQRVIGTLYLDKHAWLALDKPTKILIMVKKQES